MTSAQPRALLLAVGLLGFAASAALAVDVDAARVLARQNNCFKCHAIKADKEGPAWSKVAQKYHGKSEGEDRLIVHLTSGEKARFADGHEEEHKVVRTEPPQDREQIRNLVDWILGL